MARVGEEFPLQCPACGGDIRLIAFITEPGPIRKILTHLADCGTSLLEQDATRADRGNPRRFHRSAKWKKVKDDFFHGQLGEPLEPPPVSPARGPPTDWDEIVQAHDDRDVFQASPNELPAIDINSL